MRIALISAEFLGTAYSGGIGTYMRNLAEMLSRRGHDVEVFSADKGDSTSFDQAGYRLNTVMCKSRGDFPDAVAPLVVSRHEYKGFDVVEGAEFLAETSAISRELPSLPMVLKIHTPSQLIGQIDAKYIPLVSKLRFLLGGFVKGKILQPYWLYDQKKDYEYRNALMADELTAPCQSMVDKISEYWAFGSRQVSIVPNVFLPPQSLLEIDADTNSEIVTFIGRLEIRKGIVELAKAIPIVLAKYPKARFRLIGRSMPYPGRQREVVDIVFNKIGRYRDHVEWIPGLPQADLLPYFRDTDICIFPSVWENFPNVCLEAMSAARGVIGSSAGGMAEMLDDGRTGLLVPPRDPRAIADAILTLLRDPARRKAMGRLARQHVLRNYSTEKIGPLQEASYARAIAIAQARTS